MHAMTQVGRCTPAVICLFRLVPGPSGMRIASTIAATTLLAITANASPVATVAGHTALALAALVGSYAPSLPHRDKAALTRLFDSNSTAAATTPDIDVTADAAICRAGDIDITAFACTLVFGTHTSTLTGRRAHELFATIRDAGAPAEGAAGTIYAALHTLRRTIDPAAIARMDGSGASCTFAPGPP